VRRFHQESCVYNRTMKQICFALLLAGASFAADAPKKTAEMKEVKDPVCGMMVDPKTTTDKAEYKGKTYYFCSRDEKETFLKSPEKYVKAEEPKKK
jgi:YHS domain-containing protein